MNEYQTIFAAANEILESSPLFATQTIFDPRYLSSILEAAVDAPSGSQPQKNGDGLNPLESAVKDGNIEEIKKQMAIIDPKQNGSKAAVIAGEMGNTEALKLLLPKSSEADFWKAMLPKLKSILTGNKDLAKEYAAILLKV